MNRDLRTYLVDILERIRRIQSYTEAGKAAFYESVLVQDAVIRNFEIIGEIINRLPQVLLDEYPQIPWQRIYGFRNFLIHQYFRVELDPIWDAIENDLEPLEVAVNGLLANLPESDIE